MPKSSQNGSLDIKAYTCLEALKSWIDFFFFLNEVQKNRSNTNMQTHSFIRWQALTKLLSYYVVSFLTWILGFCVLPQFYGIFKQQVSKSNPACLFQDGINYLNCFHCLLLSRRDINSIPPICLPSFPLLWCLKGLKPHPKDTCYIL